MSESNSIECNSVDLTHYQKKKKKKKKQACNIFRTS